MAVEKWFEGASMDARKSSEKDGKSHEAVARRSMTFIYGGFGGRFDQEMGVMNALCVWGKKETFQRKTMAVYDEKTCAFLLPGTPMKSEIRLRNSGRSSSNEYADETRQTRSVGEGPTCGLIPIMGRCERVVTTGLRWNLKGDVPIEFGGLVSSSNRVVDDVVSVESSSPMVFTAEIISSEI
jgi:thiamine pyrophosphokinase